jgi:glycosyltransferase involved in cell wall biosynthesis
VESDVILEKARESVPEIENNSVFKIAAVGTLKPVKAFDRLLHIVKRLNDEGNNICLYLLGDGPLRNKFQTFIEQNHLENNIKLLGYQVNPYKYVAKCDLFVCSSLSEGFSTATTEALIVGTPVCTVEVSGMKEMLGEHNEYGIVTENTEDALYEGITKLLEDPNLLAFYKQQAEIRGRLFNTENTVKAVEDMLRG